MDARLDEYKKAVAQTKAFYDRFAQYYDEFVPEKTRADRIPGLVAYVKKTCCSTGKLHFLELGCGTASYAVPLAESGHHVIGVDISSKMRELGLKKLRGKSLMGFEYVTSDWLDVLEKRESEFDSILCIGNSLIHNPTSILPILFSSAFRALKPGGVVILNGRRIERELEMMEGSDTSQNKVCRSGGPVFIPGVGSRIALRFMFMTRVVREKENETIINFYTNDNYESDGRRLVCHRLLFNNVRKTETKPKQNDTWVEERPVQYDTWATKTYYIFEDQLIKVLEESGFSGIRKESPFEKPSSKPGKNWYIVAQRPIG